MFLKQHPNYLFCALEITKASLNFLVLTTFQKKPQLAKIASREVKEILFH